MGPLRTILARTIKHGYARQEDRHVVRDRVALSTFTISDRRETGLREVGALVSRLVTYSSSLLPTPWTHENAEAALLNYLADRGTSLLAASAADIPIALDSGSIPDADYVLASFVSQIHRADPEAYGFLTTAVKGSVLASVLYFDDLGGVQRNFDRLDVYIDTVVLVHALGLVGPVLRDSAIQMLDLARELGARLWCFRDTVKEIEGILGFAEHHVRSGRPHTVPIWGATEFLVQAGKTASDIALLAAHLEDDLRGINVGIRSRPPHVPALTIDEPGFAEALKRRVRYRSAEPLQHDLDAITAIHRLRDGQVFTKLESAKAVFITTNTPLARATTAYFREEYRTKIFAPLSMPAHQFGTLAWLKRPRSAPDLPMKMVLADAYAALNPPENLWREYVKEISKLEEAGTVSSDDCYLLRYSPAAKEALMGITVGGSRAYLEGSVPEILERVRAAERREAETAASNERTRRLDAERAASEHVAKIQRDSDAAIAGVQANADAEARRAFDRRGRQLARYASVGRVTARLVGAILVAAYITLALLQLYSASPIKPFGDLEAGFLESPVIAVGLIGLLVIGLITTLRGEGLLAMVGRAEVALARRVARALQRLVEGDVPTDEGPITP